MNPHKAIRKRIQKCDTYNTESLQTHAKSVPSHGAHNWPEDNFITPSEYSHNPSLHKKCALCVHQKSLRLSAELELIIKAWPDLSKEVKEKIIETIRKEIGR